MGHRPPTKSLGACLSQAEQILRESSERWGEYLSLIDPDPEAVSEWVEPSPEPLPEFDDPTTTIDPGVLFRMLTGDARPPATLETGWTPSLPTLDLTLKSVNRELLGMTAVKIRALRPPEPYKGKGIKLSTEKVRRKEGKTGTA